MRLKHINQLKKCVRTYQNVNVFKFHMGNGEYSSVWSMPEKDYDPVDRMSQILFDLSIKAYYAIKEQLLNEVGTTAVQRQFPYIYVRRGLKKEMIAKALDEITPMSMEQFVEWTMNKVTSQDGLIEEEKVRKWYRDYQSRFNKNQKIGTGDEMIDNGLTGYVLRNGKVLKKHKQRKSPYDKTFKGMSKEEISAWIDNADIHRQTKKRLKERYL